MEIHQVPTAGTRVLLHERILQDATGQPPRTCVRQEYVRLQTQLRNLCRDYVNGVLQVPQFLAAVGHLVRL